MYWETISARLHRVVPSIRRITSDVSSSQQSYFELVQFDPFNGLHFCNGKRVCHSETRSTTVDLMSAPTEP